MELIQEAFRTCFWSKRLSWLGGAIGTSWVGKNEETQNRNVETKQIKWMKNRKNGHKQRKKGRLNPERRHRKKKGK